MSTLRSADKEIEEKVRTFQVLLQKEEEKLKSIEERKEKLEKDVQTLERVMELIRSLSSQTLTEAKAFIEKFVTSALQVVAPEYDFKIDFITKRNTPVCDIYLLHKETDSRVDIFDAVGGGVVDIVSFALRLALWRLTGSSPILIMDEPFKFVSLDISDEDLLRKVVEDLGVQLIVVTHKEKYTVSLTGAKVLVVSKDSSGVSQVK